MVTSYYASLKKIEENMVTALAICLVLSPLGSKVKVTRPWLNGFQTYTGQLFVSVRQCDTNVSCFAFYDMQILVKMQNKKNCQ